MKKILFSIIIPAYNCEDTIVESLASLSGQTYGNFEAIIVNDGSKDKTLKVLKNYAKNDKRFFVIDQKNQGVSVARNTGLDKAKGDYIIFVDADDYLEVNGLEVINNYLANNNLDVLKYNYFRVINNKKKAMDPIFLHNTIYEKKKFSYIYDKLINTYDFSSIWTSAYKRDVVKDVKFSVGVTYAEDFEFNLKFYEKAKSFGYIENPLYNYIFNPNSVTQVVKGEKINSNINSAVIAYKYLFSFIDNVELKEKKEEALRRYAKEMIVISSKLILIKPMEEFVRHVESLKKDNYIVEYIENERNTFFDNPKLYYVKRKIIFKLKKLLKIEK